MGLGGAYKNAGKTTGLVLVTALCLTQGSWAQETGGLEAQFDLATGLAISDSDDTDLRTDLSFGLTSRTRNQFLDFNVSSSVRTDLEDGLSSRVLDPSATLSYGVESRQTAVTTDLSYRQTDADDFVFDLTDPNTPGILVFDEGDREDVTARVGLAFGRDAKFGADINLSFQDTNYSNTTRADLIDQTDSSADLTLRFEIDPTITATLGATWSEEDRETGRDVVNQSLRAGANIEVTPTLTAGLSLGTSRVTITDGGNETVQDGLNYGLTLSNERPNGNLTFALNSDLSENGRRTTATVGRTLDTRSGALSAQFGLSEGRNDDIRPLLTLSYQEALARGSYSVSLNQQFDTSSVGNETLNSRIRLDWQRDLNRTSRFGSNLTYQMSDVLGMDADTARLELGLRFSQDITDQWSWITRFKHTQIDEDGADTERENELFVGVETSFGWRP